MATQWFPQRYMLVADDSEPRDGVMWLVFHDGKLVEAFDTRREAIEFIEQSTGLTGLDTEDE